MPDADEVEVEVVVVRVAPSVLGRDAAVAAAAAAPEEVVVRSEEEVTVRGAWAAGGVERRVPPGVEGREPPKPTTGGVRTRAGEAAFEAGLEDDAEADDEGGASHVSKKSAPAPPVVAPDASPSGEEAAGR